jgi:polyhydroxyalkanoate synthesis regulator phasin
MSNPLVHAFFVGRAFAEALGEQVEFLFTDAMSELGKFDAEQRERLRQFTDQVLERANQAEELATRGYPSPSMGVAQSGQPEDLQAMIDDLRAEIAQLRAELQRYRSRSTS